MKSEKSLEKWRLDGWRLDREREKDQQHASRSLRKFIDRRDEPTDRDAEPLLAVALP